MSATVLLNVDATDAHEDVRAWRDALLERLSAGHHLVTLYGAPHPEGVRVTAVVQDGAGELRASRAVVNAATGFHTLSHDVPAAHIFERELHEQHAVRIADHPWLKPVRFERRGGVSIDEYPFYAMRGKETHEVQVGPIHAGVIEPGAFRFLCHGELVHHLEIHLGYQHRGVERLLLQRDPRALAPLVEQIAGDTSVAHTWAYAAAIEALTSRDASEHDLTRAVMLELERVAMHLAGLGGLAIDVGFTQAASTYARLRAAAINGSMALCGSRFGRTAVQPGGSGVALDAATAAELLLRFEALDRDAREVDALFLEARSVRHRLCDSGRVDRHTAAELGLVGVAARASGVALDQRAYCDPWLGQGIATVSTGDCMARAELRVRELHTSLDLVRRWLAPAPEWRRSRPQLGPLAPRRLVIAVVEGWRGEVVHALETDAAGALTHYKVQDPSLRNWMGLAQAVRNNEISDFPICNKSFDLSYCGNDL